MDVPRGDLISPSHLRTCVRSDEVEFWRSLDGGKTFSKVEVPHGDNHDLWIDPDDPKRMVHADDGGGSADYR